MQAQLTQKFDCSNMFQWWQTDNHLAQEWKVLQTLGFRTLSGALVFKVPRLSIESAQSGPWLSTSTLLWKHSKQRAMMFVSSGAMRSMATSSCLIADLRAKNLGFLQGSLSTLRLVVMTTTRRHELRRVERWGKGQGSVWRLVVSIESISQLKFRKGWATEFFWKFHCMTMTPWASARPPWRENRTFGSRSRKLMDSPSIGIFAMQLLPYEAPAEPWHMPCWLQRPSIVRPAASAASSWRWQRKCGESVDGLSCQINSEILQDRMIYYLTSGENWEASK